MTDYRKNEIKQLLSVSLCEKQDSYLIQELFQNFPTTSELLDASEQQLIRLKGIGTRRAQQIMALFRLTKVLSIPSYEDHYTIQSPKDVQYLLAPELRHLTKEHFICLFLNTKNRLIFKETISVGSLNAAIVHPREVFRAAIKHCSASFICIHNHPSGDPTPSQEDIQITKRLYEVGEIVGIDLLDHIIIGDNSYYSLKEHGHM
ncbi:RadC family protein [Paenibacillus physcomitrellae]|uniref:UPF0758 protein n=1 Tax=Paenibacillus physcomitrellae TaxID=1619311 RepID=A0ABQ1GSL2_9BACL|nr:DNA repair protein RadC [Paenibacillus physcomitrellae]GGA49244.1 UPF0758 protein [Paenibacillus physcomitrellae]